MIIAVLMLSGVLLSGVPKGPAITGALAQNWQEMSPRQKYDALGENWNQGSEFRPPPGWQQQYGGFRRAHPGGAGEEEAEFHFGGTGLPSGVIGIGIPSEYFRPDVRSNPVAACAARSYPGRCACGPRRPRNVFSM